MEKASVLADCTLKNPNFLTIHTIMRFSRLHDTKGLSNAFAAKATVGNSVLNASIDVARIPVDRMSPL